MNVAFSESQGLSVDLAFTPAINPTQSSPIGDFFQLSISNVHFVQNPLYIAAEGRVKLDLDFLKIDSDMALGISSDGVVSLVAELNEPMFINLGIFELLIPQASVDYLYQHGTHALTLEASYETSLCPALDGDIKIIATPPKSDQQCILYRLLGG